jgi:sigma-B regulation protein RsbU (phosphoserine phosphatase)
MVEITDRNRELQESLENLRRTRSAKERMEGELNIGRDIQMSMLPAAYPPFPGRTEFSVYATLVPAREVGGDFFDYFLINDDLLCVCIGDVSGKGVPSALFAAVTKTLLSSYVKLGQSPATVLTRANDELCVNNESCMFVTIFLGLLDLRTGEFIYANAGHNPPVLKRRSGELETLSDRHGPVAGAMEEIPYGESRISLDPGDLLFLYTDGVTEATNTDNELFSLDRLSHFLAGRSLKGPETTVRLVIADVHEFEGEAPQFDDITALSVVYAGSTYDGAGGLTLEIPSSLDGIARASEALDEFCASESIPQQDGQRLHIVLDELLNNIVSYAYPDKGSHTISLRFERLDFWLAVQIQDSGVEFNPLEQEAPDTTASLEDRTLGGLGIHFTRKLMDEVTYERREGRNILTAKKRLSGAGDG